MCMYKPQQTILLRFKSTNIPTPIKMLILKTVRKCVVKASK